MKLGTSSEVPFFLYECIAEANLALLPVMVTEFSETTILCTSSCK